MEYSTTTLLQTQPEAKTPESQVTRYLQYRSNLRTLREFRNLLQEIHDWMLACEDQVAEDEPSTTNTTTTTTKPTENLEDKPVKYCSSSTRIGWFARDVDPLRPSATYDPAARARLQDRKLAARELGRMVGGRRGRCSKRGRGCSGLLLSGVDWADDDEVVVGGAFGS